jgi:hypothetical protein
MTYAPVIQTQADLEQVWRRLMSPLGFGGHSVWLMFIGADDRPVPQLTQIEEAVAPPDEEVLDGLAQVLRSVVDGLVPGGRVACLRSRPGRAAVTDDDRAWASGLYDACRRAGLPAEVVHLATDDELLPLPLDELRLPETA